MSWKDFFRPGSGHREGEAGRSPAPPQKTLDALAEAVRRAREVSGAGDPRPRRRSVPPAPAPGHVDRGAGGGRGEPPRRATRRDEGADRPRAGLGWRAPTGLFGGLAIAAAIVALVAVGWVALSLNGHSTSAGSSGSGSPGTVGSSGNASGSRPGSSAAAPTSTSPAPSTSSGAQATSTSSTTTSTSSSTTTSTSTAPSTSSTTTTSTPAAAGHAPHLGSLSRSSGRAGTLVIVHGSGFFSSNGVVLARFGGHPARTACPSQDTCNVVVPSLPGSPSTVPLTITTAAGTSNSLLFHYG